MKHRDVGPCASFCLGHYFRVACEVKKESPDTNPEIERVQFEILRNMSVARRVELGRGLTSLAVRCARRAIEEAHPDASEDEIALIFISQNYGQELADGIRAHLERKG
jgi:hypothetical protein